MKNKSPEKKEEIENYRLISKISVSSVANILKDTNCRLTIRQKHSPNPQHPL